MEVVRGWSGAGIVLLALIGVSSSELSRSKRSLVFGAEDERAISTCRDYAQREGSCDTVLQCPAFLSVIRAGPTRQDIANIRNSVCGFQGRRPLVCCAEDTEDPQTSTTTTSTTTSTTTPTTTTTTTSPSTTASTAPTTKASQTSTAQSPTSNQSSALTSSDDSLAQHQNWGLVSSRTCGLNIHARIVGGKEALIGSYPWLAALGYHETGSKSADFKCGGSLITDRYVLTAAHCVTELPSDFTLSVIRLGEHDLDTDVDCQTQSDAEEICADTPQDFVAEEIIVHEQYNQPSVYKNDIALIRLDRPANITSFVSTICLPFDERNKNFVGEDVFVAGFGLTRAFGEGSPKLLEIRLPVISESECADAFLRRGADIGATQLCAGAQRGRDSCSGDSGGPMMALSELGGLPMKQIGLVSFGLARCGTKGVPGVYTRVSEFLPWILDHLRE